MSNIITSTEFMAKAQAAKSIEELKTLIAVEGIDVAEDELFAKWEVISQSSKKYKLSEEELDNVAGGCGDTEPYDQAHEEKLNTSFGGVGSQYENNKCPVCDASCAVISSDSTAKTKVIQCPTGYYVHFQYADWANAGYMATISKTS